MSLIGWGVVTQASPPRWSDAYQLHVWLREISPMIWRRLLVQADCTIASLHDTLQIAFGWMDFHLHRFRIHGKDYGITRAGGILFSDDARKVRLADFQFRPNDRFLYIYDLGDNWEHEIRVERLATMDPRRTYPVCIGGHRAGPPEDCGGPWAFQEGRDVAPSRVRELLGQIVECAHEQNAAGFEDRLEEVRGFQEWLTLERFDRREVNRRLRQHARGDEDWRWPEGRGGP